MAQFTEYMALYAPYTSIWDADWTDPYRATAIEDSYAPASSVFGVTFEDMSWPIVCDSEDTSNFFFLSPGNSLQGHLTSYGSVPTFESDCLQQGPRIGSPVDDMADPCYDMYSLSSSETEGYGSDCTNVKADADSRASTPDSSSSSPSPRLSHRNNRKVGRRPSTSSSRYGKLDISYDAEMALCREVQVEDKRMKNMKKKFECVLCNNVFHALGALRRHLRTKEHTKIQSFKCCVCPIKFGRFDSRKRHEKQQHGIFVKRVVTKV
ncbi:hypothetical protein CVT26_003312 [Gymnopilus dilepis]|uniref:C2H2-type domain-containing protein n=1 Tax=Gymnopilus dilepis TaxID=231916 RepID=A0A409W2Q9_9AGAR|nr:hypothetical protein CVT26_003312 [Gymnopilus dilepis]